MPKRLNFIAGAGIAAALALPAMAQDAVTADTVVATVGDTEITIGHMILTRARLPEQFRQLPPEVLFEGIRNQLVEQELLAQSAGGERSRLVTLSLENEERGLVSSELLNAIVEATVTEEAIEADYQARLQEMSPETEYNAAHILLETEEEAIAVKAELDAGADFAALAEERSIGPSAPQGGDLGWFGIGMMVKPFEDGVLALEPGEISDPVETQFGWHVLRLNETRVAEMPTLDELREPIVSALQEDAVTARLDALREEVEVSITEIPDDALPAIADLSLIAD